VLWPERACIRATNHRQGGTGTLQVDGRKEAEGRIDRTLGKRFSLDETFDVGVDTGTPVIDDYDSRMPFAFSGKLEKVTIDLAPGTTSRSGAFRRETPPAARRPCRRQAAGRLARSHSEQARQFMGHHLVRARDLRAAHGRTELRK